MFEGPGTKSDLDTFLQNCKPSRNEIEKSSGGWFWVHSGTKQTASGTRDEAKLIADGAKLEKALLDECERIKKEEPVRANKKLGKQSQKEWREKAYIIFNEGVGALARSTNVLSGKWLLYPTVENIDAYWAKIVYAVGAKDGALAKHSSCNTAKVAASPDDGGGQTYVICIYCDDSWDKKAVGEVLEILVKELKLVPSAYKCDANTYLHIDSKHESKIPSSLWKTSDFPSKAEIDADFAVETEAKKATFEANAKSVKKKTIAEEVDDFDAASSSEDEKPKKKKAKKDGGA